MIIKKLNSTFHKHNRWLFGAFTIVIIITFLGFLTPTTDILSVFGGGGNGEFGTCYGKSVSLEEVRSQQLKDQVLSRLFRGDYGSENLIQAFQNYCMLQAAERLGISASDVEVGEALRMIFLMQGVKENELQSFYDRLLASFQADGIPADVVNNAIRDNLILNKLQQHFTEGIVITPSEAKSYYRLANTRYQIKVAVFAASSYLGQVKPDANELRNFFSNNADRYRISGKISILVVEFPFADYQKLFAGEEADEAERQVLSRSFKQAVRGRIKEVASKYIIHGKTVDSAVVFIPNDGVYAYISSHYPDLLSEARSEHVIVSCPSTLQAIIVLFHNAAVDSERNKNLKIINEELGKLGKEFGRFIDRWNDLSKTISTLEKRSTEFGTTVKKIGISTSSR